MEAGQTVIVTLETVTPLFLGGAEPRPELRPPAFRGVLRYWLRATLGGVIGDSNLAGLHNLESAVFGSTDGGSPTQIRLHGNPLRESQEKILPHKEGKQSVLRGALSSGQTFRLRMSQFRSDGETVWRAACAALNLALTFGGVGLRARRGFGTLRVVQSSDPTLVPLFPTSLAGWQQHIRQVTEGALLAARQLAGARAVNCVGLPGNEARYPCATRKGLIRLCDLQAASAMAAVTQFMQKVPKLQAFGGIRPRQASPLWVRPIQLDGRYGLLFAVLASQFPGADYSTVQRFLDEHFNGEDIRVRGWNA
ncbi:MAG: type III-B CRISPR module RAMP protein Cmr1 [Candidatus Binatia bacterium]|nr:type III-B CRISPR module RAMP protein Cmr1 [Candidatus Binatia bacterium]